MSNSAADDTLIPAEQPDAVYRSPYPLTALAAVLFGALLLLLEVYLVRMVLRGDLLGEALLFPLLLPVAIGFLFYYGLSNLLSPIVVAVYPHGFLYARGKHVDFCPWERVQAFWCYQYVVPEAMHRFRYWVTRDDGVVFAFKGSRLENVRDLARRILANVQERLLAPALEAYAAGQSVTFGPITVRPKGVEYKGRFLHWDQIARMGVDPESDFVIERFNKTYAWCELSTARIPNVLVLLYLLNRHAFVNDEWAELFLTGQEQQPQ